MTAAAVELWEDRDGYWHWRYVNRDDGAELYSSRGHLSREEAVESAHLAYPGVVVLQHVDGAGTRNPRSALLLAVLVLLIVLAIIVMAGALLLVAVVLMGVGMRRALRSLLRR